MRKSSYQKLKDQIEDLKIELYKKENDIRILVMEPLSVEGFNKKIYYTLKFQVLEECEKLYWFGEYTHDGEGLTGLIPLSK